MFVERLTAAGRLVAVMALGFVASACATVVGGTTQDVLVESQPPGAECKVDRLGANIGVVKPTPGRVNIARSKDNVIVSCTQEGYEQSNEVLVSSFTGATVGNLLLGGLVGVVVDAASGANNKYPDRVLVVLTPANFPSDEARDAHFAGIKSRIEEGANAEIKTIETRCNSGNRELCTIELKKLTDARDRALSDLDRRRLGAKVVPTS